MPRCGDELHLFTHIIEPTRLFPLYEHTIDYFWFGSRILIPYQVQGCPWDVVGLSPGGVFSLEGRESC